MVLLFESKENIGSSISKLLKSFGLECELFTDPKKYLIAVKHQSSALSCIHLDGENFGIVLALVKSIRKVLGEKPPILLIATEVKRGQLSQLMDCGANGRIQWPVPMEEFESKVFGFLSRPMPQVDTPKVVEWYFKAISPALAELHGVLENFEDVEMSYRFFAERILVYRSEFMAMINAKRKGGGEEADLMQCLRLYGLSNSRRLVTALKLCEATKSNALQWNSKTNQLNIEPQKLLPFSTKAVEHFGEDGPFRQIAFNSGLIFDLILILSESAGERKSVLKKFFETQFNESLKKASAALKAGKVLKDLALGKHLIAHCLLKEAGRCAMLLYFPGYADFLAKAQKAELRPIPFQLAEMEKFSISHNVMGAMLCQAMAGLEVASQAVLFSDTSFLLKSSKEDHHAYTLSSLAAGDVV